MSDSTPFFTVIVAGYQCAPFLETTLASIAQQTLGDFEAICYVEESTDDSLEVCRRATAGDPRFSIVTAPKTGSASCARNYAIDHANGKYLVVVDGDDWIADDLLETLRATIEQVGELDMISFSAVQTETDKVDWQSPDRISNFTAAEANKTISGCEAIRLASHYHPYFNSHVCLNAYRLAFLRENHLRMTPGLRMEDYECVPRIFFFTKQMEYIDRPLYVYRRHPGSVTTGGSDKTFFDTFQQLNALIRFALSQEVPADIRAIWSNQWLSFLQWLLFHPKTSRRRTDQDRRKAIALLMANGNAANFRKLAKSASRPKRIAARLILLAARGWLTPAKLFFRFLYYPLAESPRRLNP